MMGRLRNLETNYNVSVQITDINNNNVNNVNVNTNNADNIVNNHLYIYINNGIF